jgi:hypothetical protein
MELKNLLSAMQLIEDLSTKLNTTSWVWGGLCADIYQGCILREHDDLDYLTLHLHELTGPVTNIFQDIGWCPKHLENGDVRLEKDGTRIHLGHVEVMGEARWTHNGEIGSLFFPIEWLLRQTKRFYAVDVHIVTPEFQYALLAHPELLNPQWIPRKKDLTAKALLESYLIGNGINPDRLFTKIHTQKQKQ